MNAPNSSPARELSDWEEFERIQRDWADLDRVDEGIDWLRRWMVAAPRPLPHTVIWTLIGQQQSSSEFLWGQSWDDQADEMNRQIERGPKPHLKSTTAFWEEVRRTEAAFEWLSDHLRKDRAAPDLLIAVLDTYVDLWIELVESASRISKQECQG